MKVSLDWLRDFVDLPADVTPQRIAERLTMSTVEVEQVQEIGRELDNVVVARIRGVEPHPANPSIAVAEVDHGGGSVKVVCGATNVAAGMKVALAREGAVVRNAHGEPFTVGRAAIRGVESVGMLCSPAECGLNHLFAAGEKEILDLSALDAQPGTALAEAIGYDDVVFEIDNKSLTNRPDLWGHHGIARELAAMFDRPLKDPPQFGALPPAGGFDVRIETPELCPRYDATHIAGVSAVPSPFWMQARLAKVGQRPINLLVDLTNYVMFAVGQPLHAFDAREVPSQIVVRRARAGERLVLLDETKVDLDDNTLVIANHEKPLALAGIMGGDLGIRPDTTEVLLEVANFTAIPVRKTARRLGLRTESSTRYEKGIDFDRVALGQQMFLALIRDAQPSSRVVRHVDAVAARPRPITVDVGTEFLQRKLGIALPAEEMRALLERLQFGCTVRADGTLHVDVPSWRSTGDVSLPEDIVEEVARLYGYDNLGFTPPVVRLEKPVIQLDRRKERRVREYFAFRAGMREVVSYPWVAPQALDAAGIAESETIGLTQPPMTGARLAPSLIPAMLTNVAANLRHVPRFRIFEFSRVFQPAPAPDDGLEHLPRQPHHVAGAVVGDDATTVFLEAKGILEKLDRTVQIAPLSFSGDTAVAWGDPRARLAITCGGQPVGALAVASSRAKRKTGIRRAEVALFELDVDALTPLPSRDNDPKPLPTYPQVEYDISMIVAHSVTWADAQSIASEADAMIRAVTFVDQYVGPPIPPDRKSLTIRLHLGSDTGTLVRQQIDEVAGRAVAALGEKLGAVIREGS